MESRRSRVWHCRRRMAYSVLARRLRGGTSCYVPSKTERSRSNLRSFVYKRACRLTSLAYHASACILLRVDYIQHFVLIPYRSKAADFIHGFAVIFILGRNFKKIFCDNSLRTIGTCTIDNIAPLYLKIAKKFLKQSA